MEKERVKIYLNRICIIILKNRLKYEGKIIKILDSSFFIDDIKLGEFEIDSSSVALIIDKHI